MKKIFFLFLLSAGIFGKSQIVQLVDSYTKENVNFEKFPTVPAGVVIDGVVNVSKNGNYYKRIYNDVLNVKIFGVNPNSNQDQTLKIQNAVNVAAREKVKLYFPNGTYYIKSHVDNYNGNYLRDEGGIALQNNSNLYFETDAKFYVIPNDRQQYNLFRVYNKTNVVIKGGKLIGDRDTKTIQAGEWGYGIAISGSQNVTIDGVNLSKMWGDGINLQNWFSSTDNAVYHDNYNITIENVISEYNRRQGMSIESGENIKVLNSIFRHTSGKVPECGVDVEPWYSGSVVKNLTFDNCEFYGNNSSGLLLMSYIDGVRVINCKLYDNKDVEAQLKSYSIIKNVFIQNNFIVGNGGGGGVSIVNGGNIVFSGNSVKNGSLKLATVQGNINQKITISDNYFTSDVSFWSPIFSDGISILSMDFVNNIVDFRGVNIDGSVGVYLQNLHNSRLDGNKFYNIMGLKIFGDKNKITQNLFSQTKAGPVSINGSFNLVEFNVFEGCSYSYPIDFIFNLNGKKNQIRNNSVSRGSAQNAANYLVNLSLTSYGNEIYNNESDYLFSSNVQDLSQSNSNYQKYSDNLIEYSSTLGKLGDMKKNGLDYYICVDPSQTDINGTVTKAAVYKKLN